MADVAIPTTIAELDKTLAQVVEAVEDKKSVVRKLSRARETLNSERVRLQGLQEIMDREKRDVERLDGLSLANLFHAVLGDKPAAIDREEQEFLTAKLRRDQAMAAVKALEDDVQALSVRLAKAGSPEDILGRLIRAKEKLILEEGRPESQELLALDEKSGRLAAEKKEVLEALEAGQKVEEALEQVTHALQSAQGWGVWDMMGGGLLATAAKHSNLDRAREQVHYAQSLITRFQRELRDIGRVAEDVAIEGFERFADYFFDGLFVDWMVQSKINTSLDRAREQLSTVRSLVRSLDARAKTLDSLLKSNFSERETLLTRVR